MTDKPRQIAIFGATSSIAQHTARVLAPGATLALVARNARHLESVAADLRVRGAANVFTFVHDLSRLDDPRGCVDSLAAAMGGLDAVMIFHGMLTDQAAAEADATVLRDNIRVNFTSAAEIAIAAARQLATSGARNPVLLVVGSVAGDRGRASNYVYGAAKGGLAIVCQGLIHEYASRKPRVVLVKPGFVDTPMTRAFDKRGPLWAKPDKVAAVIVRALAGRPGIVYAPWFWRWVMWVIRLLPQPVMNRLKI